MPLVSIAATSSTRPPKAVRVGAIQRQRYGTDPGHHDGGQGKPTRRSSSRPAAAHAILPRTLLFRLIQAAAELNPDIPCMHQDHGNSFETCKSAIELGTPASGWTARSRPTANPLHI